MTAQARHRHLCDRCRTGLLFPGYQYPEYDPEAVLAQSPLAKTPSNPHGVYSHKDGQHRYECDYFLQASLPSLAVLDTAAPPCGFCPLLRSAIVASLASLAPLSSSPPPYDAVRVRLDYFWDSCPMICQTRTPPLVTRWVLQASLAFRDPRIAKHRDGRTYSRWISGSAVFWPLGRTPRDLTLLYQNGDYEWRLRMPEPTIDASSTQHLLEFLEPNIQQCVDTCAHTTSTGAGTAFVPSRLIDVRGNQLRVVETRDEPDSVSRGGMRYTTLSYCWGTREEGLAQLRLTRESIARLQTGFPVEAMSAVQKDAVAVTRALGVAYLWIDALCILQNDGADWERESALMHSIYGHSYLTICNLKTASCHAGFLPVPADQGGAQTATVPFDTDEDADEDEDRDTDSYQIGPGCVSGVRGFFKEGDTWARLDFDTSSWITRAWTFQEAAMSPRMVLFASSGLYFSCSNKLVWEYGRVVEKPLFLSAASLLSTDRTKMHDMYRSWYLDVVQPFSGRLATNLNDSLPALSGIAHMFGAVLRDEYVAGLWKRDLLTGLFWKLDDRLGSSLAQLVEFLRSRTESTYIGPSWSWIGRSSSTGDAVGRVRSFGPGACSLFPSQGPAVRMRLQCDTLEAETTLAGFGLDSYGKVSRATLSVKARIYPLADGFSLLPHGHDEDALADIGNFCVKQPSGTYVFSYEFDFFPNPDTADPDQSWIRSLTLVLIGSMTYEGEDARPCGLIVHPSDTKDTYWRVGTFGPATVEPAPEIAPELDFFFFESCEVRDMQIV
ncbi:het-domain-containing protein [Ophiostoma piceae UAMH 11346]|uniref:Het-domain-containing protein n=1 Tax=Ophiostoma piceae (strain UAMH 11346) TaxID=1262450 RepID=S3CZT0_OPHP1|nr:het-domain-containing protein [Ophiostoma piceae UAMH 11346]